MAGHCQDMLCEDVETAWTRRVAVQLAPADRAQRGRAFDHLEAVGGDQHTEARLLHPVIGATDALQQAGDTLRGADLDDLIDRPPVDAKVERGGRHYGTQPPLGHRRFHLAALFHRQAAVM